MKTNNFLIRVLLIGILVMAVSYGTAISVRAHQMCHLDSTKCRGCGCKGGPGYRGPNGRCVGFKNLKKICGDPPTTRCDFENTPGTGANRECALHKHDKIGN